MTKRNWLRIRLGKGGKNSAKPGKRKQQSIEEIENAEQKVQAKKSSSPLTTCKKAYFAIIFNDVISSVLNICLQQIFINFHSQQTRLWSFCVL